MNACATMVLKTTSMIWSFQQMYNNTAQSGCFVKLVSCSIKHLFKVRQYHIEWKHMKQLNACLLMTSFCSQNKDAHKLKGWLTYSLSLLLLFSPALPLLLLPLLTPEPSVLSALSTASRASLLNISVMIKSCDSIASFFAPFIAAEVFCVQVIQGVTCRNNAPDQKFNR